MTPAEWTLIITTLITAGLLKALIDLVKWAYARRTTKRAAEAPEAKQAASIATVDQSLAVVARARDELEADNIRLREQLAESDARHEADRARWELRDKARREEIEVLEAKLRALLAEVEKLKDRHTFDDIEASRHQTSQYPGPQGH